MVLRVFSNVLLWLLREKGIRDEEKNSNSHGNPKDKQRCKISVYLFSFNLTELSDLVGCRRISCQNQLYKRVMEPLETSLHYLLLTELENRAMSKGYFTASQLCDPHFAHICQD